MQFYTQVPQLLHQGHPVEPLYFYKILAPLIKYTVLKQQHIVKNLHQQIKARFLPTLIVLIE